MALLVSQGHRVLIIDASNGEPTPFGDVATRALEAAQAATILGVVGAGGIGFFLMDRMMISAWREVALIVIMVLITVACIDALSRMLRARLIGSSKG
jgi:ABC-type phosphate/phosphonate transport system permease subunit